MTQLNTGIFFHYQTGNRLRDFPEALDGILEKPNILFYDALYPSKPESSFELEELPIDLLHEVHSPKMIERIAESGEFEGALYSAAGTLSAVIRIWSGDITNAFVFTGYGDHHAGSNFFGGGCYLNSAAIAIHELQKKFNAERFSVIDTDAHHGDGSWEIFEKDPKVQYICFCSAPYEKKEQNVNIHLPYSINDESYISLVKDSFQKYIKPFQPELIFWNWGYDGTIGDYGDMGLTPDFHILLAEEMKKFSCEVCCGKLVVVLCGGSRRDLAKRLIPHIIKVLAEY